MLYRAKLTDANGQCWPINQMKINELVLKIAQLTLALNSPLCGFDVESLHAEIKAELLKNECACEDCGTTGNNNTTALLCDDIDIACVWNQISILLTNDQDEKDKLCTLVLDWVNAMNADVCTMPFVAGVTFSPTQIVGNFNLSNVLNSTALKVYYKLHSSGTWILAATLASNAVTYTITGTFTPGELYDFKVANVCTTEVDSFIVSGIIPAVQDACYLLDLMFAGLADGIYGVELNSSETGCDKRKPVLLNSAFIGSLMPCSSQ